LKVKPKEELLPYMAEFRENMLIFMRNEKLSYELIHAHFFMSALVAARDQAAIGDSIYRNLSRLGLHPADTPG
jgi:D-inositol-3-phosphate glycosyltransferase